jgi:hypothetical protein
VLSENKLMAGCGVLILGLLCWVGMAAAAPIAQVLGINRVVAGVLVPVAIVLLGIVLVRLQTSLENRTHNRLLEILSKMECLSCHRLYGTVVECGERGGRPDPGGHWVDCPHCGSKREFEKGKLDV